MRAVPRPESPELIQKNFETSDLEQDMHEESIDEPLHKVYALFGEGKIQPMALLWGQRRYRVDRINSSWIDRSVRPPRHGFSVTVDSGEIFQLSYQEGNPVWRLEYVLTE